ncbi:interaptin [Artemisia annua]|uniref:Interaptin n=1 Tax=Artemisia annua TaxID=35608 RepID=A0A2U1KMQ0_ARTAN|nr:interaptin [Artemisia annua]
MSTTQDALAAEKYARPPMLYQGSYVQWSSRFMNVLMGYKEHKLLINSIKNGPYVMKEIPDSTNEGNDIYNAIDSNLTAHDLWKALERLMQDAYIRFNKLINEMSRHNLKRSNIEYNTMFLTNLQPEWRRFTIAIRQNQDLTAKDINNLFDLLKHNQVEVNDILEQKRKEKEKELLTPQITPPPVTDPLALVSSYHQTHSPFNSNSETLYSPSDDSTDPNQDQASVELTKIVKNLALLGKQIQKTFYKRPTNNNFRITSAPTAINKRQDLPPRGEAMRQDPKCFGCGQQGHFAKNCPNGKVRNKDYYRHKMLLAYIEEKGKILNADENDFMMDTDDEGELLETNMVYMASLAKVDVFEAQEEDATPSYDTDAEEDDTLVNKKKIKDMLYEEKSERPLVLKRQIQDLQNENFNFKRNISQIEKSKKNLETEVSTLKEDKANCIKRLTKAETKLRTDHQTSQTMHMLLPKQDPLLDLKQGIDYTKPSYLDIVKRQIPSLYNADYMRRDTLKDYMFVPNDISQEEI